MTVCLDKPLRLSHEPVNVWTVKMTSFGSSACGGFLHANTGLGKRLVKFYFGMKFEHFPVLGVSIVLALELEENTDKGN